MKENPADQLIRDRLQPGVLSMDGFLGTDKRPIQDIVAEDTGRIEAAGLTNEAVGDLLDEIHKAADAGWESTVTLYDGKLKTRGLEVIGTIPCPFGCGEHCHKAVVEVTTELGSFQFTPLDAHMIKAHGFYEGKGSAYRLEPEMLAELYKLCIN